MQAVRGMLILIINFMLSKGGDSTKVLSSMFIHPLWSDCLLHFWVPHNSKTNRVSGKPVKCPTQGFIQGMSSTLGKCYQFGL